METETRRGQRKQEKKQEKKREKEERLAMRILTARSRIPVLLVTMSTQGVAGWASFFLSPATREAGRTLGLPSAWIGWQVGTVYGATLIGCLFSGRIIARRGASEALQLAMLLTIVGAVVAVAFADSEWGVLWMFVGTCLIGLGYALTNPASSEMLLFFAGKRGGGLLFSLKQSSVPLGLVVAGIVTPFCTETWGWQTCAIPLILAACCSIALVQMGKGRFAKTSAEKKRRAHNLKKDRATQDNATKDRASGAVMLVPRLISRFVPKIIPKIIPWRGIVAFCRIPSLFWLAMASVSLSPLQMIVMGYTSPFAVEDLGYNLVAAGLLLSLSQGATFVTRPLWGLVSDRSSFLSARRMIALLALAGGIFSIFLLFLPRGANFTVAAVLFSLLAASAVGWNGLYMVSLARLRGSLSTGEATSSALFFTYGACFLGPFLFPFFLRVLGDFSWVFALYGVCGSGFAIFCIRRSLSFAEANIKK